MFCGWQLYPDWERLAQLGDGILEIDVLNESCKFNFAEVPRLSIAGTLRNWLLHDLATNHIPLENIQSATLTARLRVGFEQRSGILNYHHDFLLEGRIIGNGKEFKTTLEDKNGRQTLIEP
jgi:hypothetical protein